MFKGSAVWYPKEDITQPVFQKQARNAAGGFPVEKELIR